MLCKPMCVAFNRLTSAASVALLHLIQKMEGLERRGDVDTCEVDAVTTKFQAKYQDVIGEVKIYLNLDPLPDNLEEDHIFAALSQLEDIHLQGSVITARLTKACCPCSSSSASLVASDTKPREVATISLVNELPKLAISYFDGSTKTWSEF